MRSDRGPLCNRHQQSCHSRSMLSLVNSPKGCAENVLTKLTSILQATLRQRQGSVVDENRNRTLPAQSRNTRNSCILRALLLSRNLLVRTTRHIALFSSREHPNKGARRKLDLPLASG
jgi:hypothetical protein